jgi:hypothetical protein
MREVPPLDEQFDQETFVEEFSKEIVKESIKRGVLLKFLNTDLLDEEEIKNLKEQRGLSSESEELLEKFSGCD